jgi:hypothetical protein
LHIPEFFNLSDFNIPRIYQKSIFPEFSRIPYSRIFKVVRIPYSEFLNFPEFHIMNVGSPVKQNVSLPAYS